MTNNRSLLAALAACFLLAACQKQVAPTLPAPAAASSPAPTVTSGLTPASSGNSTPSEIDATAILTAMPTNTRMNDSSANADVEFVRAVQSADGSWTFHVTVRHPDTGWDDYADGWDVVTMDGTVLKRQASDPFTRLLLHPHETEQPFTRSQSGILIPDNITQIVIRAHDLVDGFGGREVPIDLTAESGQDFEIESR